MDVKLHTFLTSEVEGNELYASYYSRNVQIRRKDSQDLVGYKDRNGRSCQASNPHQCKRHLFTFLTEPLRPTLDDQILITL